METLLGLLLLAALIAAVVWSYSTGKKQPTQEVLNHAAKRKKAIDSVDSMSSSNRRKLMHKFTRK